jgi:hypothetical protein
MEGTKEKSLEKEVAHLKAALALAVGSLESTKWLINSKENSDEKIEHINSILERVLGDIEKLVD